MKIRFSLSARPPFRLDLTVWALKRRGQNLIEDWDGSVYTRVFVFDGTPVKVQVRQEEAGRVSVVAASKSAVPKLKAKVSQMLDRMLGLSLDLSELYTLAKRDRALNGLVLQFRGVKPPRFGTLFEAFVNAIACQQLSLEAGISLLNKFTECYGRSFRGCRAFPEPKRVMRCRWSDLRRLGFSRHKSEALISLASLFCRHPERFAQLEALSNEELIQRFCSLKGIGRWSAEYVLLRGLGRLGILPGDDVAIHKNLKKLLKLRKNPTYETIKKVEQKWYPFAGALYFHLLLKKLTDMGEV